MTAVLHCPLRDGDPDEGEALADSAAGGASYAYEPVTPATLRYAITKALKGAEVDGYQLAAKQWPNGRITVSLYDPQAGFDQPVGEATVYVNTGGAR